MQELRLISGVKRNPNWHYYLIHIYTRVLWRERLAPILWNVPLRGSWGTQAQRLPFWFEVSKGTQLTPILVTGRQIQPDAYMYYNGLVLASGARIMQLCWFRNKGLRFKGSKGTHLTPFWGTTVPNRNLICDTFTFYKGLGKVRDTKTRNWAKYVDEPQTLGLKYTSVEFRCQKGSNYFWAQGR